MTKLQKRRIRSASCGIWETQNVAAVAAILKIKHAPLDLLIISLFEATLWLFFIYFDELVGCTSLRVLLAHLALYFYDCLNFIVIFYLISYLGSDHVVNHLCGNCPWGQWMNQLCGMICSWGQCRLNWGFWWLFGNTIVCQSVYLAVYRKKIARRAKRDFHMALLWSPSRICFSGPLLVKKWPFHKKLQSLYMDNQIRNRGRTWKITGWNIRGINSSSKWKVIRSKIHESSCDIICIHGTKRAL
jgi:hypothetical protein